MRFKHIRNVFYFNTRGTSTSNKAVRVRFAPSPTGFMHLGGLRTALYNFLFAKSNDGTFVLRIEDTDQSRVLPLATQQIESDLRWAGLPPDESPLVGGPFHPYKQSERLALYSEHAQYLLKNDSAYYCFCSDRRLELLRKEALRLRQIPRYDNKCRNLSNKEIEEKRRQGYKSCIRFKIQSNCDPVPDLVYDQLVYNVADHEGDPVILKSDGYPTYHFANVIDDHFMEISHVLRGVEWQISTSKHVLIYKAFNWEPPVFAHLPLILNEDGTKLSKRQGDVDLEHFRKTGIFPLALLNFITSAGGGFLRDENKEKIKLYTLSELVTQFDVKRINVSSGRLQPDKLKILNNLELQRQLADHSSSDNLVNELKSIISNTFKDKLCTLDLDHDHLKLVLTWSKERINSLNDLVGSDFAFLWVMPLSVHIQDEDAEILNRLKLQLNDIPTSEFDHDNLKIFLKKFSSDNNYVFSKLMKTLRHVLSGVKDGPGVAEMMDVLGKERSLSRLEQALTSKNNAHSMQN